MRSQQRERQCTLTRTDFDQRISGLGRNGMHNAVDHRGVVQKILAQMFFRAGLESR